MCIIRHSKHFNTLSVIFHILSWSTSRWWGLVMRSNYSIWRENNDRQQSARLACNRSSPLYWAPSPHPTIKPIFCPTIHCNPLWPPSNTPVPHIALPYPPPPYCLAPKPCLKPLHPFTCTRAPLPSFLFWTFIFIQPALFSYASSSTLYPCQ